MTGRTSRAELHDGDDEAIERERARTEAWVGAFHLAEERKRLGLTQKQVAELMGVSPGRVSQIENGDLDVNEVATLSRYARALGARAGAGGRMAAAAGGFGPDAPCG